MGKFFCEVLWVGVDFLGYLTGRRVNFRVGAGMVSIFLQGGLPAYPASVFLKSIFVFFFSFCFRFFLFSFLFGVSVPVVQQTTDITQKKIPRGTFKQTGTRSYFLL
jgi:hypothetical protein